MPKTKTPPGIRAASGFRYDVVIYQPPVFITASSMTTFKNDLPHHPFLRIWGTERRESIYATSLYKTTWPAASQASRWMRKQELNSRFSRSTSAPVVSARIAAAFAFARLHGIAM
jgi:hypothetical protein